MGKEFLPILNHLYIRVCSFSFFASSTFWRKYYVGMFQFLNVWSILIFLFVCLIDSYQSFVCNILDVIQKQGRFMTFFLF